LSLAEAEVHIIPERTATKTATTSPTVEHVSPEVVVSAANIQKQKDETLSSKIIHEVYDVLVKYGIEH